MYELKENELTVKQIEDYLNEYRNLIEKFEEIINKNKNQDNTIFQETIEGLNFGIDFLINNLNYGESMAICEKGKVKVMFTRFDEEVIKKFKKDYLEIKNREKLYINEKTK